MTSLPGGPINQTDERMVLLTIYGWAMWAVQTFEYRLAGLTILRAPVKNPGRVLDTEQKVYSALQKQFAVYLHRFERASAKELQKLLPDDLSEALRSELDELVDARNDLAHRYLRRILDQTPSPDLPKEAQALKALGERFVKAGDRLLELMEQSVGTRPPNVSDAQFQALQRLGNAAALGESLDDALRDGA
jgi:hypothetical protein